MNEPSKLTKSHRAATKPRNPRRARTAALDRFSFFVIASSACMSTIGSLFVRILSIW